MTILSGPPIANTAKIVGRNGIPSLSGRIWPFGGLAIRPTMRALCLLLLLWTEGSASWTAKDSQFLKGGEPRLLLVVSDLEPTRDRLAAYREAGLDAVWVRSLLNDTPEGIKTTLSLAESASMPLIGGLPIPNLKHLQVERIRRYAKEPAIAAWCLSTSDGEILEAAKGADPDTLFLVRSDVTDPLPARTGRFQYPYHPDADAGKNSPALVYTNISKPSGDAALGLLARLVGGGDGLVFSLNYKGVPVGEKRLEWLQPRIPLLRQFHKELNKEPWRWQEVTEAHEGVKVYEAITAAGDFVYCRSETEIPAALGIESDDLVLFQASDGAAWKDGKVSFSKKGELWLGPRKWRDRVLSVKDAEPQETATKEAAGLKKDLLVIQSRIEAQFEFCAKVFSKLSRRQLERHVPALLPHFRKYYGEPIAPLTELKSADGRPMDLADAAFAGEAEDLGEKKRKTDELGTAGMTGESELPLKQQIKSLLSREGTSASPDGLLGDLRTLEDGFLNACLRWESSGGASGPQELHPIGESELAGGVFLLNFSSEPVEMLLADAAMEMELWTSALLTPDSEAASAGVIRRLAGKSPGVRSFGKTRAVNYSQGYTVVIPPAARREIMVPKNERGQFYYVPLNRRSPWASRAWGHVAADEDDPPGLAGSGTEFYIDQKPEKPPVIWPGELWRPLDTLSRPPDNRAPLRELKTHLYRGEWQTVGFSIHNPNDAPMAVLAWPELDVECTMMAYAYTRVQLWTLYHGNDVMLDLRFSPPDRPVPDGPANGNLVYLNSMGEVWVPPHQTRQLFLILKADGDTPAGDHRGQLHLIDPLGEHELEAIALEVNVWPMSLPPKTSFKGTGFTIGSAIFRPKNAQDAYDHYFNHLVTTTVQPEVSIDWEKEEIVVGEVPEEAKEKSDLKSCLRLAPKGFTFFLSGWGSTGMDMKYGGIGGFIDQSIREKNAAAENEDAKDALTKLGTDLKGDEEEEEEFEDEIEDEEEERPKSPAELLREKAERIKKKYWPGTPGYEKLSQQVYKKAIDFYLAQGFRPVQLLSYVWDEAPRHHFPSVVRMAELMKEVHPNIRTYVTCLSNLSDIESKHAIDIYTPHMGHVYDVRLKTDPVGHAVPNEGRNATNLKAYQATGRELWVYMQHGGYMQGKHAVDYPMGLLWRAWQMDLAGCGIFSIRNCRGDLGFYPTKCYEAWREGVEDFLAMRALEADLTRGREQGLGRDLLEEAERTLRERSQEVLGAQWWWSDMSRRYRLIRAARQAIAEVHVRVLEAMK